MSFLLDTTAVSESGKPRPNAGFAEWYGTVARAADLREQVFVSALVIGELDKGILRLAPGPFRDAVTARRQFILAEYPDRILPVDLAVARTWAEVAERHRQAHRTVGAIDELIAATALAHDLTVVTRNVRHFEYSGSRVVSPWTGDGQPGG